MKVYVVMSFDGETNSLVDVYKDKNSANTAAIRLENSKENHVSDVVLEEYRVEEKELK